MPSRLRGVLGVLLLLLSIATLACAADKNDAFARCLSAKGATMYGDFRCPHCAKQKAMFGEAFKKVHYVECGIVGQPPNVQTQQCRELQIKNYPTWSFQDGDRLEGPQTLQKLGEKTGCQVP
jgi:transcription elongation factor Elf1